jgi:hypothetical protein
MGFPMHPSIDWQIQSANGFWFVSCSLPRKNLKTIKAESPTGFGNPAFQEVYDAKFQKPEGLPPRPVAFRPTLADGLALSVLINWDFLFLEWPLEGIFSSARNF